MNDDTLFVVGIVWVFSALVAGGIASDRERSFLGFAAATLFFLGPLGPGFALIATHGRIEKAQLKAAQEGESLPGNTASKVVEGRQRFRCPRCRAENDIPNADTSYECWRCGEARKVIPKKPAVTK